MNTNSYAYRSAEAAYLEPPEDDTRHEDCEPDCEGEAPECIIAAAREQDEADADEAEDRAREEAIEDRIDWAGEADRLIELGPDDDDQ